MHCELGRGVNLQWLDLRWFERIWIKNVSLVILFRISQNLLAGGALAGLMLIAFKWWVVECLRLLMLRHQVSRCMRIVKGGKLSDKARVISTTFQGGGLFYGTLILNETS